MAQLSRTYKSARNAAVSTFVQFVTLVVSFLTRTVFIKLMNADYLGVNGLFSNVLAILAFSELGISSAIIYNMYKPVSENDTEKVSALLNFYKKAYRYVAAFILIVGVCLTPFIHHLIKEAPDITENLVFIYLLFLANTVVSYLYSYSRSVFTAHQNEYVNVLIERCVWIGMYIIQLVYLYMTHDFYGYLFIQVLATLSSDLIITLYSRKKYPEITNNKSAHLLKSDIKGILKDIYALFAYKIGGTILHSTSNIIMARIINITVVGICSNYLLVSSSIEAVLQKIFNSIVASIGNLNATSDSINKKKVLYEVSLLSDWIYGVVSICLFAGLNQFVLLWIGKDYVFSQWSVVFCIILSFFISGINFAASNYRTTMGFFRQARYVPLFAAFINVWLSIFLGIKFGVAGIFVSISIARFFTFNIIDPFLVCRKGLQTSVIEYYWFQFKFIGITLINGFLCHYLIQVIHLSGLLGFVLNMLICFVLCNFVYFGFYFRSREFRALYKRIVSLTRRV